MSGAETFAACFLVGPTAVGKSSVAQFIAGARSASILSADSMLIYRGMDIGTATPTAAERGEVPYFGINLIDPSESFSVWDYRVHALEALQSIQDRGDDVIVVGGTGLYVKSLTHGLTHNVGADPKLRAEWQQRLKEEGIGALQDVVKKMNPVGFETLSDKENPRRLIRVLETAGLSEPQSTWEREKAPMLVGLSMDSELLNKRIEQRVEAMYAQGLLEEVEQLLSHEQPLSSTARQAIGYAEAIDLIEGRLTEAEAKERTIIRTRRLAKRQRTWFRNQANVDWVEVQPGVSVSSLAEQVVERWGRYGPAEIKSG